MRPSILSNQKHKNQNHQKERDMITNYLFFHCLIIQLSLLVALQLTESLLIFPNPDLSRRELSQRFVKAVVVIWSIME